MNATPAVDLDRLVAELAERSGKRVGTLARRPNATITGRVLASVASDDGASVVLLDGGREIVSLDVESATARALADAVGSYASARCERDLGTAHGFAWRIALGDTFDDAARGGAISPSDDADLRAALFLATDPAAERPPHDKKILLANARAETTVTYGGPALDQDDLDAYLAVVSLARTAGADRRMSFVTAALDGALGRPAGPESTYASLERMSVGTIRLHTSRYDAAGRLVAYVARDAERWQVDVSSEFASLFDPAGYAAVLPARAKLASPLAKWVHARAYALRADATFALAELAAVTGVLPGNALESRVRVAFDEVVALGEPFASWSQTGDRVTLRLA